MKPSWTMRRRLMLVFAAFTLFVALAFSAIAVLFLYAVEDRFFSDALKGEVQRQVTHRQESGRWAEPRSDYMTIHDSPDSFPADLRERFVVQPARSEFAGTDGRHYHLTRLRAGETSEIVGYVVAEVNEQLVVRQMRAEFLQFLMGSIALVFVVSLALGLWLARRTSEPLGELARQVEAMQPEDPPLKSGQNFRTREIDVLAGGLVSLTTRVHEFVVREREFTRDVSHELRTPLAVIRSGCERLEQDPSLSASARRQVAFIQQSTWQLQQCVATLLSLAREEQVNLPEQPVAILPLIEQVILEQGLHLEGKNVDVIVAVDPETQMRSPSGILHILLGNLVGNAFAHTVRGQVRIHIEGGRLCITNTQAMMDSGMDDLFEPYAKGDASEGFGLGLAIVRRLCERYGLDLRIQSGSNSTCASLALEPIESID